MIEATSPEQIFLLGRKQLFSLRAIFQGPASCFWSGPFGSGSDCEIVEMVSDLKFAEMRSDSRVGEILSDFKLVEIVFDSRVGEIVSDSRVAEIVSDSDLV